MKTTQATWKRALPVSEAEQLLRRIFKHLGINEEYATSAALQTMVERYKREGTGE